MIMGSSGSSGGVITSNGGGHENWPSTSIFTVFASIACIPPLNPFDPEQESITPVERLIQSSFDGVHALPDVLSRKTIQCVS